MLDQVGDEMAPYFEATRTGPDDFSGHNTRRTGGLIARSVTSREPGDAPARARRRRRRPGPRHGFQLHLTQVIAIGPGEPAQTIHRDQWAFDFFPFPTGYEVQCNTIWAMADFTEENGATRVIPGSHRFDDRLQLHRGGHGARRDGGRLGALLHRQPLPRRRRRTARTTVRRGLNITYNVAWLRQEENQYLRVPLDVARTLRRRPAAADGLRARRLRPRLRRRPPRPDRRRAARPRPTRLPGGGGGDRLSRRRPPVSWRPRRWLR